jgi:hypothetical protein
VALRFRQWAFESAALDLALRQAGRSLHDVLGLEPQPVRFVNSLGLGKAFDRASAAAARCSPGVRFKLDAEATWPPELVDEVAATCAVDTIDFKGRYGFEIKDPEALGALYDRVLPAFPDARQAVADRRPALRERLQRGGPSGPPAGQPADAATRAYRFPLDGVRVPVVSHVSLL